LSLCHFRRDLKIAITIFATLCCGLLPAPSMPVRQPGAQVPTSKAGAFPEKLLEGTSHFDLALSLQGDLRGNYGPCG
jgi:hypothetical protein